MAKLHRDNGATLSISLSSVEDPSGFGVVELGNGDRIVRFVEKPAPGEAPSSWANAGTWIFEPEVLEHISDERMDGSLERLVFPSLIADGFVVQGFTSPAYWMDVGTCERYLQLHGDILGARLDPAFLEVRDAQHATGPVIGDGSQVWPDAHVADNVLMGRHCRIGGLVTIEGPTVMGVRCDVRDKARIENSVFWSNCKIGSGALIRDSILGNDVWIGDDAIVEGAVLANGARVKRGIQLSHGARLEPDEVAG